MTDFSSASNIRTDETAAFQNHTWTSLSEDRPLSNLEFHIVEAMIQINEALQGTVDVEDLSISGTLSVTGATALGSTLAVTGAATLSSTCAITGNATVGGTLGVTGASTLTGNVTASGTLAVTDASTLTGNVSCGGTLGVTGASTLTGNVSCGGTLGVTGASTLSGDVTLGSATPTLTVGNSSGSPTQHFLKSDAGTAYQFWYSAAVSRAAVGLNASEDMLFLTYDAAGDPVGTTTYATLTGNWTFPAAVEIDGDLNHDGSNVGLFGVTPAARPAAYTITNDATDRTFNADTVAVAELADVVATVIKDLTTIGALQTA